MFFSRCPGRRANQGSFWFSFIFSLQSSALDHAATAPPPLSWQVFVTSVIDDDVVDDELSVGAKLLGDAVLVRAALRLHLVEVHLQHETLVIFFAKEQALQATKG